MATQTSMDVGILERIGDAFNAFSEGTLNLLTRLMGSSNERVVRDLGLVKSKDPSAPYRIIHGSLLAQVNDLEPKMRELSDAEMKELTPKFRDG